MPQNGGVICCYPLLMLTLLCPDLSPDPDQIASWSPPVARRLARARVLGKFYDDSPIPLLTPSEAWLKRVFAIPEDPALTISAYQRYCFGPQAGLAPDAGQILTATPAYLHATLDHLVLSPASELTISDVQAAGLAAAANEFLAQDGIELKVLAPECWVLILPTPLQVGLHGSLQASGRNIHAYMPYGQDGRRLRALLNELQMLWHDHPVNQARAASGEVPINSLWIEGIVATTSAAAPDGTQTGLPFERVISDSLITRGLAIGCGIEQSSAMPAEALAGLDDTRDTLVELAGPKARTQVETLLGVSPSPVRLVLCDDRRRLELLSAPGDKLRFWRGNALRSLPAQSS